MPWSNLFTTRGKPRYDWKEHKRSKSQEKSEKASERGSEQRELAWNTGFLRKTTGQAEVKWVMKNLDLDMVVIITRRKQYR